MEENRKEEIRSTLMERFGMKEKTARLGVKLLEELIEEIKMENSNAKATVKEELKKAFDSGRVEAMEVFKGFAVDTHKTGWHYKEFGRSDHHYMGKSLADVKEYVSEVISMRESC